MSDNYKEAVIKGDLEKVKKLYHEFDVKDTRNFFILACEWGHLSIVEYIYDNNIEEFRNSVFVSMAAYKAAENNNVDILQFLIDKKLITNKKIGEFGEEKRYFITQSLMESASYYKSYEIMKFIDKNYDVKYTEEHVSYLVKQLVREGFWEEKEQDYKEIILFCRWLIEKEDEYSSKKREFA